MGKMDRLRRSVDKPIAEQLEMLKNQPEYFFMNLGVLGKAHEHDVLVLPGYLFALYKRLDLGRFRLVGMIPEERSLQTEEYRAYVNTLAYRTGVKLDKD